MITCHKKYLIARCNERGYSLEEVKDCIINQEGDILTIDENHSAYPRKNKPNNMKADNVPIIYYDKGGPGTELKKLLSKIGIKAKPNCSCNARAKQMDLWGCDECEKRIDEIVGWLREEANKRKLPFIDYAGKMLIKRAIKNARNKINKKS